MSQFGGGPRSPSSSVPGSPTTTTTATTTTTGNIFHKKRESTQSVVKASGSPPNSSSPTNASVEKIPDAVVKEASAPKRERTHSRPGSMMMSYQPPMMEIQQDTLPELQPIFSYLNSHANKLYQEGYFLKLHDLDSRGRPSADRVWNECFAQLVGTVLSLWDAQQLDDAGEDGEVVPSFINLTDASIKMIESLPMNGEGGQCLQNVLSISTAANNRYLLHFNSLHSLTQWTAGIRLAMYEHTTLQEAYTGSILAGKGKYLNSIKTILERSRFPTEDWTRVRFGVGTPWRRCWCVITPPDEKELQKAQKNIKKRSAYDRTPVAVTGDIKFYDTRKVTKKTKPIASITDAYAAYSIYPQSKALIDQSTLIKIEGHVHIHGPQESVSEGFVFIMPEVHPAVTGFELMLRFIIPVFDTFALYGRPGRLVADVTDTRSLMFAMPTRRPYGYLELIDVAGLIHTEGSQNWAERDWRKQMKNLTSKRMTSGSSAGPTRASTTEEQLHRRSVSRSSLNISARTSIKFGDQPTKSMPTSRKQSPQRNSGAPPSGPPGRVDSAPPSQHPFRVSTHQRAVSDAPSYQRAPSPNPSSKSSSSQQQQQPLLTDSLPPAPPPHVILNSMPGEPPSQNTTPNRSYQNSRDASPNRPLSFGLPQPNHPLPLPAVNGANLFAGNPPVDDFPIEPVQTPPVMAHKSSAQPRIRPPQMPEMRRANSAIDAATLVQLQEAQNASQNGIVPSSAHETGLPMRARDDSHIRSPSQEYPNDRYSNASSNFQFDPEFNPRSYAKDAWPQPPPHGQPLLSDPLDDLAAFPTPPSYSRGPSPQPPPHQSQQGPPPSGSAGLAMGYAQPPAGLMERRSQQSLPPMDFMQESGNRRLSTIPGTPAVDSAVNYTASMEPPQTTSSSVEADSNLRGSNSIGTISRKPLPIPRE